MNARYSVFLIVFGFLSLTSCKTGSKAHQDPAEGSEISATTPEEPECPPAWLRTPASGDTLFAWAKQDNDFGTRTDCKDTIGNSIVPENLANYILESLRGDDVIHNVYQVTYSDTVSVYFVRMGYHKMSLPLWYKVYSYDHITNNFTKSPPYISGNWLENDEEYFNPRIVKKPYCSFMDITGDSVPEIVVKKRTHMGTAFDTVEERYFRLTEEAELELILVVEPIALEMMNVDCVIKRELHGHTIETYLDCPGEEREKLGTIELAYSEGTFNISDMQFTSHLTEYERFFLSSRSSESDSVFIHTGR